MSGRGRRRAVFLDRDGTIVREVGYVTEPAALRLLPGSAGALAALARHGFDRVLVTNQSAIARGFITEATLALLHAELNRRLRRRRAALDAFYFCPHHPRAGQPPYRRRCTCRKPGAGLLRRAAAERGIDLARSFMVGDSLRDVLAARRAGVQPILVRTGHGAAEEGACRRRVPDLPVCRDLAEAARLIVSPRRRS